MRNFNYNWAILCRYYIGINNSVIIYYTIIIMIVIIGRYAQFIKLKSKIVLLGSSRKKIHIKHTKHRKQLKPLNFLDQFLNPQMRRGIQIRINTYIIKIIPRTLYS